MSDEDQLQKRIKEIMIDIMIVLYEHGIKDAINVHGAFPKNRSLDQ